MPRRLVVLVHLSLATVLLLAATGCGSESGSSADRDSTSSTGPVTTTVDEVSTAGPGPEADAAASCVSDYSAATLRERSFAFDGTMVERRDEVDPKAPTDEDGGDVVVTRARFEVHEWFAGGSDPTVLVWMMRDVAVGERLLVTGEPRWGGAPLEDAIAWECGFTAGHSEALAVEWRAALSS